MSGRSPGLRAPCPERGRPARRPVPLLARAAPLLALLALAGCDDANMVDQGKAKTWDRNAFFDKGQTLREPVAGTVPRADPARAVPQPATVDAALMAQGREAYAIHCVPCHGLSGNGRGMIVARGFPPAPPFTAERLVRASAAELYGVIANGKGAMYGLAQQIRPRERWAIVAYVRALQLSQGAALASLPPEDRARVEAAAGSPGDASAGQGIAGQGTGDNEGGGR